MKNTLIQIALGFCLVTANLMQAQGQGSDLSLEKRHALVDHVGILLEIEGQKDSLCFMGFSETWVIDSERGSISKVELEWDSCCSRLLRNLPLKDLSSKFREISYEFHLLDPHLVASDYRAFSEADSMDAPTRALQQDLIELVLSHSDVGRRYQLSDQLLSVIFHEQWDVDPDSLEVSKKVRSFTPVIWQRRQTESGEPINEAETGFPVYYKIELQPIPLRNP